MNLPVMRVTVLALIGALSVGGCASPGSAGNGSGNSGSGGRGAADQATIAQTVAPSLVRVQFALRYDKGEAPSVHEAAGLIADERPLEIEGVVLSPTRILVMDPLLQPRFLKGITVRDGEKTIAAKAVAYGLDQTVIFLEPDQPLAAATPLRFEPAAKGPYYGVDYAEREGQWSVNVQSPGNTYSLTEDSRKLIEAHMTLVVDRRGVGVGYSTRSELDAAGAWKGSPLDWKTISQGQLAAALDTLQKRTDACIVRVDLSFRSPKNAPGTDNGRMSVPGGGDEYGEGTTEANALGVLVSDDLVLIPARLDRRTTARLDRIRVYPTPAPGSATGAAALAPAAERVPGVAAKFVCTLKDYGALLARAEKPLGPGVALYRGDIRALQYQLVLAAQIEQRGEQRISHLGYGVIGNYVIGRRGKQVPEVGGTVIGGFVFTREGELVSLALADRRKLDTGENRYDSNSPSNTPVSYLSDLAQHPMQYADPGNVPLAEDQEQRLAWVGVELQAMNPELARANKIADQTQDGRSGALVTYVYPNSPAAKAGLETGDVLLRLSASDMPKPWDIEMRDAGVQLEEDFPWERLAEAPEGVFDRIPRPWPSPANSLSYALTELGFGSTITLDLIHSGQAVSKPFTVVETPHYYDSAPRYKNAPLGVTVRELTYEVRRYLHLKDTDPGVVVSKIEPGSKVSVAGLKPFELVTHVNDRPVANIKEFEEAVKNGGELRLSAKTPIRGHIVKVTLPEAGATSRPALEP